MLVNAVFYPVLNYDTQLHQVELVCCGWGSTESQVKVTRLLSVQVDVNSDEVMGLSAPHKSRNGSPRIRKERK